MNFGNFQIQNWISQTVRAQKVDEKNGVICLISFFLSWDVVLKLPKLVHFFQIYADLSRRPKHIKAIYSYPSERPNHALSENTIFYRVPKLTAHEILKNKISRKVLTQQNNNIHQLQTLIFSSL